MSREETARTYQAFADHEARGRSPLYEELARGVAGDREVLDVVASLPFGKRQPNLLFAAVRFVCGLSENWQEFRAGFLERREDVVAVVLTRRTQTNEPARCATLLPLLAALPQPLALLEVGASAGLCLLPDRYAYDYGGHHVAPTTGEQGAPTFACCANAATPLPQENLEVAWRAGLDLAPVDVRDPQSVAWLEALVWPGEGRRLELLRAALDVARADPPAVVRGDLRTDLPALAATAPRGATLVVFHSAVLAYVHDPAERAAFAATVAGLGAVWVANEAPGVVAPAPGIEVSAGRFLLTRDARPVALTDPHGASVDWLA